MSELESSLTSKIVEGLNGLFGSVAEDQRAYYKENPSKRPVAGSAEAVISSYANMNALVAGAASMVPGPWGMLSVVPEIILVVRNQLKMIYDLGVIYGKEDAMTRDLLLGVFAYAMGSGALGLVTVKGSQVLVRRASLRIIQKIVTWLGGKITQRVLKQLISRYLPLLGAAAMAYWARQTTVEIGRAAAELLQKDVQFTEDEVSDL
jgi:uncharacterized protein (DUF697 family)